MAGNKYIELNANGQLAERAAVNASAGATDANKVVALNASGLIDATMLPTSGAVSVVASENLSAGDFINVFDNAGTIGMRKADNTSPAKRAHGFVQAAVTSGSSGTAVLGEGINASLSGLTQGATYFLGTVGAVTTTVPTAAGSIVQVLGVAKSTTELSFVEKDIVVRA
jgi:hypothetical protein